MAKRRSSKSYKVKIGEVIKVPYVKSAIRERKRHIKEMSALPSQVGLKQIEELSTTHWKTSDGRNIHVTQLTNDHLFNAIKFLAKKGKYSEMLNKEWARRQEQFEQANRYKIASRVSIRKGVRIVE
jgi:hypothetical protein